MLLAPCYNRLIRSIARRSPFYIDNIYNGFNVYLIIRVSFDQITFNNQGHTLTPYMKIVNIASSLIKKNLGKHRYHDNILLYK